MTLQKPFGHDDHDSLQYHFLCGDILGAARLFRTPTLDHASFWVFDGGLRRIHDGAGALIQSPEPRLDVTDGAIRFSDGPEGVSVAVPGRVSLRLEPRHVCAWGDTISTVIHQPDMACELVLDGRALSGVGYCKRYAWTPAPRHWGYRFVQGWTADGAALWTAEATFGTEKYDYFRLLEPDGSLREGAPEGSRHRRDTAIAALGESGGGGEARARLDEPAVWEAPLASTGMDSALRQGFCRLVLETPEGRREGSAINETCYGTLG